MRERGRARKRSEARSDRGRAIAIAFVETGQRLLPVVAERQIARDRFELAGREAGLAELGQHPRVPIAAATADVLRALERAFREVRLELRERLSQRRRSFVAGRGARAAERFPREAKASFAPHVSGG